VRVAEECRAGLVRQVAAPVRWHESVERLRQEGASRFLEIGPGAVLSGLVRKIDKEARVANAEDPQGLEAALAFMASGDPA
jgi:[acyl-carrier-protein] S-malonyltransferase